ncbi:MAG: type I-B CRISPR-associated protein Cas7/Cst2/DevR [Anaerolineae bacterium]|jgi:CRISPR-associated protein Cst2|nr:type I-B CRISPR-associated protein Cas7/Cst2/DevR [Anaerolineae bacterium]
MAFITGMIVIDANASALNNSDRKIGSSPYNNSVAVKQINTGNGAYVYVTAQAFRSWVLKAAEAEGKVPLSPTHGEDSIAYADGNPIKYWNDDLFGYMRASNSAQEEKKFVENGGTPRQRKNGKSKGKDTTQLTTLTRISPFRMSTLVAIEPNNIARDFSTMSRHEGNSVIAEHQFYRVSLQGLFSVDLHAVGRFTYLGRTGYQNLDEVRKEIADKHEDITHIPSESAYLLSLDERVERVNLLIRLLGRINAGAKQTLHYTDVTPAVTILAFTRGGNHPFNYLFSNYGGTPRFNKEVFQNAIDDVKTGKDLLSPVFIGWKHGYLPEERTRAEQVQIKDEVELGTPREAYLSAENWLRENSWVMDLNNHNTDSDSQA